MTSETHTNENSAVPTAHSNTDDNDTLRVSEPSPEKEQSSPESLHQDKPEKSPVQASVAKERVSTNTHDTPPHSQQSPQTERPYSEEKHTTTTSEEGSVEGESRPLRPFAPRYGRRLPYDDSRGGRFRSSDERGDRRDGGDARGGRYRRFQRYNKRTSEKLPIDYKNPEFLKRFLTERGKILPRSVTGISAKVQRKLSRAVKRARFMGFLPCA